MGVIESVGNAISEIPSPSEMCDSLLESETYETASHLPFVPDIKHVEDLKETCEKFEEGDIKGGIASGIKTYGTTMVDAVMFNEIVVVIDKTETGSKILDGGQLILDGVWLVPGVGWIADLSNAAISSLRGDWTGTSLSLFCAIPVVGMAGPFLKMLGKVPVNLLKKFLEWLLALLKRLGLGKMFVEFLAKNWKKLKELIGKGGAAVKGALAKGVKRFGDLAKKATKGFKKKGTTKPI